MHPFTALFLAAFALATGLRLGLAWRQYRHVSAHRESVPCAFSAQVSLEAHRKAADYTCAKTKLGAIHTLVDAALLIALTLGGGLNLADRIASGWFEPGIAHGIARVARMLAAIEFNDQSAFATNEIDDVRADRFLALELQAEEAVRAQVIPEVLLGRSLLGAQGFGVGGVVGHW